MSKLADTLKKNKVDPRRVIAVSKTLEGLTVEDRAIKLLKAKAKGGDEKAKAAVTDKEVRSGKAVTPPTLNAALAGETINGPAKTRILRAVNQILTTKKQSAVTLKDLF